MRGFFVTASLTTALIAVFALSLAMLTDPRIKAPLSELGIGPFDGKVYRTVPFTRFAADREIPKEPEPPILIWDPPPPLNAAALQYSLQLWAKRQLRALSTNP